MGKVTKGLSNRPGVLTALREIARVLSGAWDLDTTLDLIAQKTTEVMEVDSCTIYLLDTDGEMLRMRASTGLAKRAVGRAALRVGEGMTGLAVLSGEPVHAVAAQAHPAYKKVEEADELGFTSLLAVPMSLEGRPIGGLNVQTLEAHAFTENEVATLGFISDLAAGALTKAELHDAQRRQIEELRTLARVSEAVTSPQYLDDILNVVTTMAARSMEAAVCALFLLNERGTHLELRAVKRAAGEWRPRRPLPLGEGVTGQVAVTGEVMYVADVRVDERYVDADQVRAEGLVSLLSVPLSVRDRVIGVLNCYTAKEHLFTDEQKTLFLTLANQTALAIENMRLVASAAMVKEMHHRIKNNLQTVAMLMQMQIPEAGRLDTRHVLETNINRIHSIAAVHEELAKEGFRLVAVKQVLQDVGQMTAGMMVLPGQEVDLLITGESLLLPSRMATSLALVVNELIQNALEHAFVGGQNGHIQVLLGKSTDELIVLVRDDGVGLPDDYRPGLGLDIATTLIHEDLRGQIKFHRLVRGTEVSIRMSRTIEDDWGYD
ncbi:MAG TPA: GAF domain-containing protein [Anaerolineae bacterium]|nr:GAF domain-containing protein [Anaerolineae bacterium]